MYGVVGVGEPRAQAVLDHPDAGKVPRAMMRPRTSPSRDAMYCNPRSSASLAAQKRGAGGEIQPHRRYDRAILPAGVLRGLEIRGGRASIVEPKVGFLAATWPMRSPAPTWRAPCATCSILIPDGNRSISRAINSRIPTLSIRPA